ncbi:response regulator transcription factor [Nitrincola iocasae]|jgi:RNA polymerase sigma factor (sigma-70 family)|uniref:Response regulator transcription factor n=1 Tax=Nitrincola iocasae TaxID=2614693 RepID=A0A5J6LEJ8_9GAMM|nr:response regulator [Nitrincola iocasae]QEW06957.1 response regulator transcription factor [Nitrincola iocasae]
MRTDNNKVFLVDDDTDFRDSMQWLLSSAGYDVVSTASAIEFLDLYENEQGCLLLDVRMPGINGLALQQILQERDIQLPVILISGHGDIPMAVNAIKAGALDFIEKPFDDRHLLSLVSKALLEAENRFKAHDEITELKKRFTSLSQREREVMALVILGQSNRDIADRLGISPKTVEVHRARVMAKMQATSLPMLVNMGNQLPRELLSKLQESV